MSATCFECGAAAHHEHHAVPRSRGGTKTVPLCATHHAQAHGLRGMDTGALTMEGLFRKRLKGERTGAIPFGFTLGEDGQKLVAHHDEQMVLQVIWYSRVFWGRSYKMIADQMNRWGKKAKGGGIWYAGTIRSVLRTSYPGYEAARLRGPPFGRPPEVYR